MKRILIFTLSLTLALSLAACTPTQEDPPEDTSEPEQTAPAEPDDQEPQETVETTAGTEPTEIPTQEVPSGKHLSRSLFSNPPRSNSKKHRHQSFRVMAVETLILVLEVTQARPVETKVVLVILVVTPAA